MVYRFSKKDILGMAILIFLACLAWLNILDKVAYNLNIKSMQETLATFAIIKGVDAIISLIINTPFIGGVVAPINDFLDRISWVMLVSLMSLSLQKIIIVAFQSFIINLILSISVSLVILNKFINIFSVEWAGKILKFTIIVIFIRFSIPLMTVSIMSIESGVQKMQAEISQDRVDKLQEQVLNMNELINNKDNAKKEKESKIQLLETKIETFEKNKETLKVDIKNLKNGDKTGLQKLTTILDGIDPETKEQIELKQKKIEEINVEINNIEEEIDKIDSFDFSIIKSKIRNAAASMKAYMTEMFDVFVTMVVLFLFKNVIFPIGFLFALFKLIDRSFNTNSQSKLMNIVDNRILKKES